MKRPVIRSADTPVRKLLRASLLLLVPIAIAPFFFFKKAPSDPVNLTNPPDITTRRLPRATPDFWASAIVPDPGEHTPAATIRLEDLGITPPATPEEPQVLIARAISENNLPLIHSAVLSWFQQDPTAARDWLASQTTFEDLQPAISYIASSISEKGDLKTAIEWAKLLPEGTLREDTLFDMHALALRNRQITYSEINPEGISPERFHELLSGAAGD